MQLIGSFTSPYVRKVSVALREKGLTCEFINEPPWAADSKVPTYNPLGKVPAFVADDGQLWFDSNVILAYLETLVPTPALYPTAALPCVAVQQLVMLADGVCDAGVAIFLERKREAAKQDEAWIKHQVAKIERGLVALETAATAATVLGSSALNAADVATVCMLDWLSFRLSEVAWRERCPSLLALHTRLSLRPSFAETLPKVV